MCIGNLRSGTENLHHYLHTKERKFLDSSLLYYGIIICFIIGAVIGNAVVRILHEKAILGCSFLLFVAFLIMFIDREKELYDDKNDDVTAETETEETEEVTEESCEAEENSEEAETEEAETKEGE